ncbi:hypothetical protein AJ79_05628 [Helicocarpus griseus UAMH5409]|uniref:alpha-galactosidase n=1 Tax=Helicocarpus griseus UAMH5409 TaxID=1447875 RepID=A0A2B7XLZ3_9EURO|nr:hypothetical protein AJ79_05628 [Helicocarpus griseus UAMH5409]
MAATGYKSSSEAGLKGGHVWPWSRWSKQKTIIICLIMLLSIAALAVGLGVGLCRAATYGHCPGWKYPGGGRPGWDHGDAPTDSPTGAPTPPNGELWQPAPGTTWQINLVDRVKASKMQVDVYDIDLFDNEKDDISRLKEEGRKIICYFSAGSFEDWREDAKKFEDSDLGRGLDGWDGEKWLNTRSENVRNIMLSRLDMAKDKGCNGVDPDNVDGYDNNNGLNLSQDDAVNYITFLADAAHQRGLSMGLKNAVAIIPKVKQKVEFAVNEQCLEYSQCGAYKPLIDANKAVFHIEYPKGEEKSDSVNVAANVRSSVCGNPTTEKFSSVLKNINLDEWAQTC